MISDISRRQDRLGGGLVRYFGRWILHAVASVIDERHIGLVVSLTVDAGGIESGREPADVRRAQRDRACRDVLGEIAAPLRARYGHDVGASVEQPGDGD